MAILSLVQDTSGCLYLHSTAPSKNAAFSIFDIDGEGSGDPFGYGNNTWTAVEDIEEVEYDENDTYCDCFWRAQQTIVKSCVAANIELPEYVAYHQIRGA